jgi:hypothetical protein
MSIAGATRVPLIQVEVPPAPGVFCTCLYNHARRLRLEKLLYLEISRSPNGFFNPLLERPLRNLFGNETVTNL